MQVTISPLVGGPRRCIGQGKVPGALNVPPSLDLLLSAPSFVEVCQEDGAHLCAVQ